jgi:hypothetical protein
MAVRTSSPTGRRTVAVLMAGVMLIATACADRPGLADWETEWEATYASLPSLADLSVDDPTPVCSETLGMLRAATAELADAPTDHLRDAFLGWAEYASSVFFECPPHDETGPGFEKAYLEIRGLAAEVDALLVYEHESVSGVPSGSG